MAAARKHQLSFADLEFLLQGVCLDPVLQSISDFLDEQTDLTELVRADLESGLSNPEAGRKRRLTPQQVLRSLVLRRVKNWDYREMRERIADSYTLRRFTGFFSQPVPKHDSFHRAFRRLQPETLRTINERVVAAAGAQGLEDGKKLRVDTTVVETDIPTTTGCCGTQYAWSRAWQVVSRSSARTAQCISAIVRAALDAAPWKSNA